ncbi:MAG: hypothetical protein C4K49_11680 [Candidatus Thorarchaeota archaeon]|nr:MAG: hypothetical protein C4K49_11680 [Candidatus Thorarchaeota archaeon]
MLADDIVVPLIPECSACIVDSLETLIPLLAENKEEQFELFRLAYRRLSEGCKQGVEPVILSILLYRELYSLKGVENPLREIKRMSIKAAQRALPEVEREVSSQTDYEKLRAALAASIAGNLIDYNTSSHRPDLDKLVVSYRALLSEGFAIDDSRSMWESLTHRKGTLVFLADNAGETLFDTPLVRLTRELGWNIDYVVKARAMVNDATEEDVRGTEIEGLARIITTGAWAHGVPKRWVSQEFLDTVARSDMVISKGQANIETFPEIQKDSGIETYYVLKAKCPHIAQAINAKKGDNVVLRRPLKVGWTGP